MDYKACLEEQREDLSWYIADNELKEILLQNVGAERGAKILNIGCGTGEDSKILAAHGKLYAIDISPDALDLVPSEYCEYKTVADAEHLPFGNEFFDIVCMFGSLEHMKDDRKVILEVRRVLKRGGTLLLTGPAYQWLYSGHDATLNHFRRYNRRRVQDLTKLFAKVRFSYWNTFCFLPIMMIKLVAKLGRAKLHDTGKIPGWADRIALWLLRLENELVKHGMYLPFGMNFFAACMKRYERSG